MVRLATLQRIAVTISVNFLAICRSATRVNALRQVKILSAIYLVQILENARGLLAFFPIVVFSLLRKMDCGCFPCITDTFLLLVFLCNFFLTALYNYKPNKNEYAWFTFTTILDQAIAIFKITKSKEKKQCWKRASFNYTVDNIIDNIVVTNYFVLKE